MSINQLLTHPNYLINFIEQSDLPTIRQLCQTNRQINQLCQYDPLISELILQKQLTVEEKTDRLIALLGRFFERGLYISEAIGTGDVEIVDELIRRGYDPTRFTFLRQAVRRGYLDIVDRLLSDPRVDPTASNNAALKTAHMRKNVDIVNRLLQDARVWNSLTPQQRNTYKNDTLIHI